MILPSILIATHLPPNLLFYCAVNLSQFTTLPQFPLSPNFSFRPRIAQEGSVIHYLALGTKIDYLT